MGKQIPVSIATLDQGALVERVDYLISKANNDIKDINSNASATRTVNIKITIKPVGETRTSTITEWEATYKPAAMKKRSVQISLDENGATEYVPEKPSLELFPRELNA